MAKWTDAASQRFVPHDLLLLDSEESFVGGVLSEPWVKESLAETRAVVVRRGAQAVNHIPVGVRGRTRSHRCAGFVSARSVIGRITPELLVEKRLWRGHPRAEQIPAIRCLESIRQAWSQFDISWGPTGSVGFELATKSPVTRFESDLDLRVLAGERFPVELAQELLSAAESETVRIDVQMETPLGSVSLIEYARRSSRVLLRTNAGPILVHDPWTELLTMEQRL